MCINYPGIAARRLVAKSFEVAREKKSSSKGLGGGSQLKDHRHAINATASDISGGSTVAASDLLSNAFDPAALSAVCGSDSSSPVLRPIGLGRPDHSVEDACARVARQVKLEPTADKSTFLLATTNTTAPVPQSPNELSVKRALEACYGTKRKVLKPGCTAKNHIRHFVQHNYHDYSHDTVDTIVESIRRRSQEGLDHASGSGTDDDGNQHPHDEHEEGEDAGSHKKTKKPRKGPRGGVATPFPVKLYEMLESIEDEGYSHIVSWQPHGRCFVVHKPKEFVATIMPKYFRQSKLTSFQRQLNLYGFARLTYGVDRGGYYHEMFLRGRPFLASRMVRVRVKGTGIKAASSPASEPDFYTMPSVEPLDDSLGTDVEEIKTDSFSPTLSPESTESPSNEVPPSLLPVSEVAPSANDMCNDRTVPTSAPSTVPDTWMGSVQVPAPLQKEPMLVSPQQQVQRPAFKTQGSGDSDLENLVPVPLEQCMPYCECLNQLDAVLNPPVNFEGQTFYCLEQENNQGAHDSKTLVKLEGRSENEGTAIKPKADDNDEDMDEFFSEFLRNAEVADTEASNTDAHARLDEDDNQDDELARDEYFQGILMSLCSA